LVLFLFFRKHSEVSVALADHVLLLVENRSLFEFNAPTIILSTLVTY